MFSYQNKIGANLGMTVPRMPTDRGAEWASTQKLDRDGIYNALEIATPALSRYGPELMKLKNKAYVAIITGEKPLSYFDEFVHEFMGAGGAEVLQEANVWYREHTGQ
ncbi:hypothetical protein D1872_254630 [compost metagenome]